MLDILRCNMVQSNDTLHPCSARSNDLGYQVKSERILCEGCGHKIQDRYLMKVGDGSWHEHCLACSICGIQLSHSCYSRNNKFYCKMDYDRLFGVKCTRCGVTILPQEMVMRAQDYVYHLPCFICIMCCQPLQKGEQFVLRGGQLFCRPDYENEMLLVQQSSSPENLIINENCRPRDGRRGPKRPRTILTSVQRRQFKASFEVSPKPCRKVREALAKDTGLSVRVVQVWFQNQRAKMKKIQRKAKQENEKNCDKNDKGESDMKQENIGSDHSTYIGEHSGESFCSSDVSLDGSTNMEEGTGSDSLSLDLSMTSRSHDNSNSLHHSSMLTQVNPIDKLYLMQNSYFSANE
ncbi:LIM/homeobox protein LMX-1.2 isoform X2 [Planococcus citri]|uniref:LIM/homeobox protein LMX-1.2 isoform X2 n=1 Tax=Planococcus citri TaxID=170843 RepID=UPI0031F74502